MSDEQTKDKGGMFEKTSDTKYKGSSLPKEKTPTAGVKQIDRGKNKGKWCAFYRDTSNLVYTGLPRDTRGLAMLDLTAIRARIYV